MTILQVSSWTDIPRKYSHNCNVLCSPGWGAGHAVVCRTPKMQGGCKEVPRPGMIKELEKEHYWEHSLCFRTILAHVVFGFPHKAPKIFLEPHYTMRKGFLNLERGCDSGVYSEKKMCISEFCVLFLQLLLPGLILFFRDQLSPEILQCSELHMLQNDQLWRDLFQRIHLHHGLPSHQKWSYAQSVQHQPEGQITKFIHKTQ